MLLVGYLSFCQYFAGIPDFSEVYSFIGSVFDPETNGHVQKLKEMDPINFETVSSMKMLPVSKFYNSCRLHRSVSPMSYIIKLKIICQYD